MSKLQNFNIYLESKYRIKRTLKYISNFFSFNNMFNFYQNKNSSTMSYTPKEFCYQLQRLSKKKNKRIILPESYEVRILQAASMCYNLKIARCVLLGQPQKIHNIAYHHGINLNKNIEIIDPKLIKKNYVERLVRLRRNKGINKVSAEKFLENNTFLATLILEANEVDGLVSGSVNTTADTIRPALQIIKTDPYSSLVSSIFFMLFPDKVLIYGDCAINVEPNAEQLANIAIQSANSAKMFGITPRVAMLSYSTGYSGQGDSVEKIRKATSLVKHNYPNLIIEGPIQYDAAVSQKIAKLKMPYSTFSGDANIFIFPDLNSGNITYKAIQRSLNLTCVGPMLQGLKKPVNDLSRGCSIEDIVYTIALTSIQSQ